MGDADTLADEFDTVAWWTADAVEELGDNYALPAACRGSGSPAGLDWLAGSMKLSSGSRLLDSGAGVGGPAEYVAHHVGVRPILAEPMQGACRAARRLFDHPVVAADGSRLPFPASTFDAAWSLGVLCTIRDKSAYLRELVRTIVVDGVVGLLVYTHAAHNEFEQPPGNYFPSRPELVDLLTSTGLTILDRTSLADLPSAPTYWQHAGQEVESVIARDHHDDPRWRQAQDQQDVLADLIKDERLNGDLIVCHEV